MIDLGLVHMMLVYKYIEFESYRIMEASPKTLKETLGSQAMCYGLRVPAKNPNKEMCRVVEKNLKLQ